MINRPINGDNRNILQNLSPTVIPNVSQWKYFLLILKGEGSFNYRDKKKQTLRLLRND